VAANLFDRRFDDAWSVLIQTLQKVDRSGRAVFEAKAAVVHKVLVKGQLAAAVDELATLEHAILEVAIVQNDAHVFENFFVMKGHNSIPIGT
jgi:hypothetical protein